LVAQPPSMRRAVTKMAVFNIVFIVSS